jgi:hypothetical protein
MKKELQIRTHQGGWAVFAVWFGKERPVYGGSGTSIEDCLEWRATL